MAEREKRLLEVLGTDPNRVTRGSLTIEPVGDAFAVSWTELRILTPEELIVTIGRASQPPQPDAPKPANGRDHLRPVE